MSVERWTYHGLSVTPLEHTRRRVAGGTCIDIEIHDPRSTVTRATVNADNLKQASADSVCGGLCDPMCGQCNDMADEAADHRNSAEVHNTDT